MTVDDCIDKYTLLGDRIFGHPRLFCFRGPLFWPKPRFSSRALKEAAQKVIDDHNPSTGNPLVVTLESPKELCKT